ncbi:hypothetical protein OESDEN_02014 [Oesophagostomum dentatum]|uniref:Uncharacterized protein n=1 Tax=Oesophagostomum dentatum TaxID=61180 RepID=A0A0B1TRI0_OESDE|nr:hypothetical protein OESDEN_02014 [Oesophagostomum dentatum]
MNSERSFARLLLYHCEEEPFMLKGKINAHEKRDINCRMEETVLLLQRRSIPSQYSQEEEDPYRKILQMHSDNVSHLVLHGSSLKSMSSKSGFQHQLAPNSSTRRARYSDSESALLSRPGRSVNG